MQSVDFQSLIKRINCVDPMEGVAKNSSARLLRSRVLFYPRFRSKQALSERDKIKHPAVGGVLNCFCGERGIRTHGPLTRSTVFKTAAFNRSAISPIEGAKLIIYPICQNDNCTFLIFPLNVPNAKSKTQPF